MPKPVDNHGQIGFKSWAGPVRVMPGAHAHNDIEINLVTRGRVHYILGGRQVTIEPGRLACFWGALPHHLLHADPGSTAVWVTLPLSWVLRWELPDSVVQHVLAGGLLYQNAADPVNASACGRWPVEYQNPEMRGVVLLEVQAAITRLCLTQPERHKKPRSSSASTRLDRSDGKLDAVVKMSRFMSDHWDEPVSAPDIAKAAKLNPNYATTLFKKTTGQSLIRHLTQLRLANAQRLLATTDLPVLRIAMDVGFGSLAQFYEAFGREVGQSPGMFRKSIRKNPG
jgi:AraC-like DNA-binding protein